MSSQELKSKYLQLFALYSRIWATLNTAEQNKVATNLKCLKNKIKRKDVYESTTSR